MENEFDGKEIPGEQLLDVVKEASEILQIITKSKEEGKSIAISSPPLGEHFVVTAVEDIITENGQTIVQLKPFDATGYLLPRYRIPISEILAVCPFTSSFKNPVLKNFDRPKNWYF